jgi:hypothetical protein
MSKLSESTNAFMLIPENLYNILTRNKIEMSSSQKNVENSHTGSGPEPMSEKRKILENKHLKHKSKLLPYITPPELHHRKQIKNKIKENKTDEKVINYSQPATEEAIITKEEITENITENVPVTGVKQLRTKNVLKKFFNNPNLGLSITQTILLNGIDTNVQLTDFLYKLQTSKSSLPQLYKDISKALGLEKQHVGNWITIK